MYWALTMVMKSPWLPPGTTSEQAFSSATVTYRYLRCMRGGGTYRYHQRAGFLLGDRYM